METPESTNAEAPDPDAASHADQVSKLNLDTLTRFTNLVETGPSANFADFFRIEGDWYTRALRKLRPDDGIPNLGCAEGPKYIATKEPQSLKQLFDRRPNRDALDELVSKINQRCCQKTTSFGSKYRQIPTRRLMARVHTGRPLSGPVFRVSEDLIVKKTPLALWRLEEAANIQYIARWTKIPVPEIVRVYASDHTLYIFMSFIDGTELQDLWPTMTIADKTTIANQLKIYMTELRSVEPPSPWFFWSLESHICIDSRVVTRLNVAEHCLISSEEEFN